MGRSVSRHPRAEVTAHFNWEENHVSYCGYCDRDIKRDWNGSEMVWVPAFPSEEAGDIGAFCPTRYEEQKPFGLVDGYDEDFEEENYGHEGWDYDSDNFQNDREFLMEHLMEVWPSLREADDRGYGEVQIILENELVEISLSEYCGMIALCVAPRDDIEGYTYNYTGLAKKWIGQMSEKFLTTFDEYARLGSMSNGESIYQKVEAA